MITIRYPEIISLINDIAIGLLPVEVKEDSFPTLLIKANKEIILTAKVNRRFSIYVVPIEIDNTNTFGLISAFFDDEDEPLVIYTPFFQDPGNFLFFNILFSKKINIYFFDENSREYLGYSATLNCPPKTKKLIESSSLLPIRLSFTKQSISKMSKWFGLRTAEDDDTAISVTFDESLFPEDIFIQDLRPENHSYYGAEPHSYTELIRKEPGPYQERDIVQLLQRVFAPEEIFLNPLRTGDREEIVDILVYTRENILLIQAKDSPNIESTIKNTIARKKATTLKSLKKAINQTKGAIRYISSSTHINMIISEREYQLDIGHRKIRTLALVKELFNDEFTEYSPILISIAEATNIPCIALDYAELNMYTNMLTDERTFFEAYDKVYDHGIQHGEFPRLRILPNI